MKEHSDAKNKYTEEDIIKMLEFLVDNIFVVFAGKVFQQIVGIPMGTNCAPLLADIFLYSYEAEFIQSLLSVGKKRLASQFNSTYILKQKSLATHHRYEQIIKEIHVEINTNFIRCFCGKCDYNLIQYQISRNFICMERSACHKTFFKRTKFQYFEHSPRASETVPDNFGGHSRTRDSS